jgi:hypothetical protein
MNLFDYLKMRKPEKEPLKDIREAYRRVFSTHDGKMVLTHLLSQLHFFDEVVDSHEIALSNFSRRLLYFLGVWDSKNLNDQSLIEAFLRIPEKDEEGNMVDRSIQGESLI